MTECPECGFVYESVDVDEIPIVVRDLGSRFSTRVSGIDDAILRRRPDPVVWSPLEYLCHVRDVFLIQRDRAVLALIEDRPSFPRMHRDERVNLAHYAWEAPGQVAHDQLRVAADLVARVFSERFPISGDALSSTTIRSLSNVTWPGWRGPPSMRANTT